MVICKELLNARNAQCESQAGYVFVPCFTSELLKIRQNSGKAF